jgi:hypothetical protein
MGALSAEADRLEAAAAAIVELGPRVEVGGDWPLAEDYGTGPEASWGPREVLAHVEEYLPYWLGEIERVLAGDASAPVPFGRVAEDPVRIGVIGRDRTMPFRELFARVAVDAPRVAARLRELSEADASRVGLHPRRGEMQIRDMLDPFLVGHTQGHVNQLREILDAAGR